MLHLLHLQLSRGSMSGKAMIALTLLWFLSVLQWENSWLNHCQHLELTEADRAGQWLNGYFDCSVWKTCLELFRGAESWCWESWIPVVCVHDRVHLPFLLAVLLCVFTRSMCVPVVMHVKTWVYTNVRRVWVWATVSMSVYVF